MHPTPNTPHTHTPYPILSLAPISKSACPMKLKKHISLGVFVLWMILYQRRKALRLYIPHTTYHTSHPTPLSEPWLNDGHDRPWFVLLWSVSTTYQNLTPHTSHPTPHFLTLFLQNCITTKQIRHWRTLFVGVQNCPATSEFILQGYKIAPPLANSFCRDTKLLRHWRTRFVGVQNCSATGEIIL